MPNTISSRNVRRRVSLACNSCRIKRTKCDGHELQCSACSYRGTQCEYTQEESKRKRPSNAYVLALEERVKTLERMLSRANSPQTFEQDDSYSDDARNYESDDLAQNSCPLPVNENLSQHLEESDPIDQLTDALGCFTLGDTGELRFFGASSNFSIVPNHSLRVASSIDARLRGIAAAQSMQDFFEPNEELRDELLALFWRWQNSWQYLVAREAFVMDLYVHATGRYCTPLLLTAILAYASRYSSRPELRADPADPNTAGEVLANQARTMLHQEYEAPTTSTVQAAALLGLYWASIDREGLGFMYIGMATRMAMNLGLHLDCTPFASKGIISEEEVEVRKIAFWGIYVLDKLYCLGMGRPASIQEFNITTPKPKAEDLPLLLPGQEKVNTHQPWPTSQITDNAMQMCEIFIITSEVMDQIYAQKPTWSEKERNDRVNRTQLSLVKWFDNLSKTLKISESSLQPSPPFVYQLHLQYHVSIILLHRPFLKDLNGGRTGSTYDVTGGEVHSRLCQVAAAKISSIFRIYRKNFGNRYIPISAVHPAFTASIIHLLHLKMADTAEHPKTLRLLQHCVTSLFEMNLNWDWANRSIRAIQSLANEWRLDVWNILEGNIDEEYRLQYMRYVSSCSILEPEALKDYVSEVERDQPSQGLDMIFESWMLESNPSYSVFNFHTV